ncbi:MAG: sensor histidine kinase [Verrucomicrobia bacterium]|nr:sensor histidine kinase [Verrucomicrobiota bacterium]
MNPDQTVAGIPANERVGNREWSDPVLQLASHVGRLVARFQERTPLWEEICRLTLSVGGFAESWFGRYHPETGLVYGLAQAGQGTVAAGRWEARWDRWRAEELFRADSGAVPVRWVHDPLAAPAATTAQVGLIVLAPLGSPSGVFGLVPLEGMVPANPPERVLEWLRAPLEIALAWEERQEQWRRRDHDLRQSEARLRERLGDLRLMAATERLADEQALRETHRRLRALAVRMESIQEEERARISREIHDELGQKITGLKMDLYRMEERLPQLQEGSVRGQLEDSMVSASASADEIMSSIQRIASELRPALLDRLGLLPAVRFEAQKFQERTGTQVHLELPEDGLVVEPSVTTAAYRIFQEILTNVTRHAQATAIDVSLQREGDRLRLRVRDNGRGVTDEELRHPRSLGLLGMSERAAMVGGSVEIRGSSPGTTVTLLLPLSPGVPSSPKS